MYKRPWLEVRHHLAGFCPHQLYICRAYGSNVAGSIVLPLVDYVLWDFSGEEALLELPSPWCPLSFRPLRGSESRCLVARGLEQ